MYEWAERVVYTIVLGWWVAAMYCVLVLAWVVWAGVSERVGV